MWLSQQLPVAAPGRSGLSTGKVTIIDDKAAVMLEGERRELPIACPSAVRWVPKVDDEVLVFTTEEGERYVVGLVVEPEELPDEGEIILRSGGSSLKLYRNGVSVNGRLVVNGVDILAAIESLRGSL